MRLPMLLQRLIERDPSPLWQVRGRGLNSCLTGV